MKRLRSRALLCLVLLFALPRLQAQEFDFQPPAAADEAGLPAALGDLAGRMLPVYEDADRERYLSNLSALQLAAGDYAAAADTRKSLQERRHGPEPDTLSGHEALFDVYARARAAETGDKLPFAQAFTQSFREAAPRLGDREAYGVIAQLEMPLPPLKEALRKSLDQARAAQRVTLQQAVDLIWSYLSLEAVRSAGPLADALAAEDNPRRYLGADHVLIKSGRATIDIEVIRPKSAAKPLPALLEFTRSAAPDDARDCAAHGYAGVVAHLRVHGSGSARYAAFGHEGEYARAAIAWIVKQPWSDGRVGMYGERYAGFAAWAAAKRPPSALKAIATSDAMAPGIDFPDPGHIFHNAAYRWALDYAGLLDPAKDDEAHWRKLDRDWYRGGKSYRELEVLAKQPSAVFGRWLSHPSYDRWWQRMIPSGKEYARIGFPVLSVAGYGDEGEIGSLYYFTQQQRYQPQADHTLVIAAAQDAGTANELSELRWQWLDHVFHKAVQPALLSARLNYKLKEGGEWRHAPDLAAAANSALKLYLDSADTKEGPRLARGAPANLKLIPFALKLDDRGDASDPPQPELAGKRLDLRHALAFVSEALPQPMELAGRIALHLDFTPDRQDFDLNFALYERLTDGSYRVLSAPEELRASYAQDRTRRKLLKAGERQSLDIGSERFTAARLQTGSRIVLVLGANLRADRQVNYGTGGDVSEETIEDGDKPLKISWWSGSYLELAARR